MIRRNVTEKTPSGMANPFIDTQFKLIFDERNIIRFLNSILKPEKTIVEVQFENTERMTPAYMDTGFILT